MQGRNLQFNSFIGNYPIFPVVCFICFSLISCAAAQNQTIDSAEEELKSGNYSPAITTFKRLLEINPSDARAQRGILQAYLETGQYSDAEREAKRFQGTKGDEGQAAFAHLILGEVNSITGRYNEAIAEFEKAESPEERAIKLRADLRRAEILELTGKTEAAEKIYQTFASFYQDSDPETAEELTLVARALVHLEKYKEANDIFLEAIDDDKDYIEAHLEGGELYTTKYNYDEAADFLKDALRINPNSARAHLAIASNKQIEGGEQMNAAVTNALKINPNYVEAKTLAASLDLDAERYQSAAAQLDSALKINPQSLDARALRAAMFWLQNRQGDLDQEVKATLAINPRYGKLYEVLAHFATQTRRYSEAVAFSRTAVGLSPRLWSSHLALGIGLLRLGRMDEGRTAVELAFSGDPFNIWAKNTLDLLDTMKEYRETKIGDFIVKADAKESDVLFKYAPELLIEAQRKLTAKYRFTPRAPISVEIFPNHDDFAVRALGLPGLGALGVCFGQVIAQDSPYARRDTSFNWGSTLWHEYTHVITLQITDHLIPRWFSEGLSVFEEHNARPGWGDDWTAEHMKAFGEGKWYKIADLDNGFIRPKRPQDVALAYFEAYQVCRFITERSGFDTILEMLRGYREKKKTTEILQQTLKLSEADFDREFNKFISSQIDKYLKAIESGWKTQPGAGASKEETYAKAAASPNDFALNLRAGHLYLAEGNDDKAIVHLKRAIEAFPFHTSSGNAYEALTGIYEKQGNKAAAAETLEGLIKIEENNYAALKKLANLKIEAGDQARALELLQLSFFVNPGEHSAHTMAGTLHLEKNETDQAVREFQVALAANPPNVAEAHYNIARAYAAAGKKPEAKRSVLRALEAAPGFDKAQELLLRLTNQ
ncbi:MAG: tetratricopeptide repeat protein [Acidobacteria bacterium]|nr:tetratricopeptide repeat protein [Acidobacteriota bacterium]